MKLSFTDCGAKHGKVIPVTGLKPNTITLGQNTEVTGSGSVDEDVSGGSFTVDLKAFNGDICKSSTFNLPLNSGSITWEGLSCPQKAGAVSVPTKIELSASLPASLARAEIKISGKSTSGDDLLCMDIKT